MSDREHPADEAAESEATAEELPFDFEAAMAEEPGENDDDPSGPSEASEESGGSEDVEPIEVDDGTPDWAAMEAGPSELTSEEYLKGTTQEYQGLAEEIERASA